MPNTFKNVGKLFLLICILSICFIVISSCATINLLNDVPQTPQSLDPNNKNQYNENLLSPTGTAFQPSDNALEIKETPFVQSMTPTMDQSVITSESVLPTATLNPIIWSAGMETGDISEWQKNGDFVRQGMSALYYLVSPLAHSGQYSVALSIDTNLPSDTNEHGAFLFFWDQLPEPAYYYSAWFYIPSEITPDVWWTIWQWKSTNNGNTDDSKPMFSLGVETDDGNPNLRLIYRPDLPDKITYTQTISELPRDKWFQIQAYYQKSEANGHVIVWQDGVQIFDVANHPTVLSDKTVYWSVQNYARKINPNPSTIYIDDAIISTSKVSP